MAAAAGPEVTVIIDDRQPGTQKKVIVIPRASPWLMEMLTGDRAESAAEAPRLRCGERLRKSLRKRFRPPRLAMHDSPRGIGRTCPAARVSFVLPVPVIRKIPQIRVFSLWQSG